jgi:hypothetical protein
MDRIAFTKKLVLLGVCPLVIQKLSATEQSEINLSQDSKLQELQSKKQFVENWLSDLLDSMEKNLDRPTQEKLVAGCGVACFKRHSFKTDIANAGKGDLNRLIEAYKKNFEIWHNGNEIHIRYDEDSKQCYCLQQITEHPNLMISIVSAHGTHIKQSLKQPLGKNSGLGYPRALEEGEKHAISLFT